MSECKICKREITLDTAWQQINPSTICYECLIILHIGKQNQRLWAGIHTMKEAALAAEDYMRRNSDGEGYAVCVEGLRETLRWKETP